MGHYDDCRPGYCGKCGAAPGNIRADGTCNICIPDAEHTRRLGQPVPKVRTAAPRPPLRDASVAERRAMRPANYAKLGPRAQWRVDAALGLLDDPGEPEPQFLQAKDNHIAQVVNRLRDTCKVFHDSHQLRERIANIVVPELRPVSDSTLAGLRALRLHHWQQCLKNRKLAEEFRADTSGNYLGMDETADSAANFHIKQVQLLNIFFAVGDTAEGDDHRG